AALAAISLASHHHFVRDAQNLAWRYGGHPAFAYEFFLVRGQGDAAIGLRVDQVGDTKVAHVVECFGLDTALPGALAFIDQYCEEGGIGLADFTCPATALAACFLEAGWFSTLDDKDVQAAHLFHPPEFRDPPTTSLMLWSRDDMADLLDYGRL